MLPLPARRDLLVEEAEADDRAEARLVADARAHHALLEAEPGEVAPGDPGTARGPSRQRRGRGAAGPRPAEAIAAEGFKGFM